MNLLSVLLSMPRFSKEQWARLNLLGRWLTVSRAAVLVMTVSSCLVGGLLAAQRSDIDEVLWLICLVGLILAHATNNQANDLVDFNRGVDDGNYYRVKYGSHALQEGLMSKPVFWAYFVVTGASSMLIGLYLIYHVGSQVVLPFTIGFILVLFYTHPLKGWGLGEVAVWLAWGPLMVGATHMVVLEQDWNWQATAVGAVFGVGPTVVIFGKHIDKITLDAEKGVRSLPVRLGEVRSRKLVQYLVAIEYAGILALIVLSWLPLSTLLVAGAIPSAVRLVKQLSHPKPSTRPEAYPEEAWPLWFAASTFVHTRLHGLLFVGGLLIGVVVERI